MLGQQGENRKISGLAESQDFAAAALGSPPIPAWHRLPWSTV